MALRPVYIPLDLRRQVEKRAKAEDTSVSQWVADAVERKLAEDVRRVV